MRPIDADAAKKALTCWFERPTDEDIEYAIDQLPTLDYAPVMHASWIPQDDTYTKFQCGLCKTKNYDGFERYCPNCGAKMDGGKEHDAP